MMLYGETIFVTGATNEDLFAHMKKTAPPWVLPICILLMGLLFSVIGLHAQQERQKLERSGISASGQVISGKLSSGSKGKKNYHLRVRWSEDGAFREQLFPVKRDFFAQHVVGSGHSETDNKVTAPEVSVRTIPGQPEEAIIVGGSSDHFGMQYLGYPLVALGLFLLYRVLRRKARPAARPLPQSLDHL
jgi:hypothetical protein